MIKSLKAFVSLTVVIDKYALNIEFDLDSVACIFVIDHSQWQICTNTVCDSDWVACIFVIDHIPKGHCLDLCRHTLPCIIVIDHSQWQICNTECDLDSVACIFVIDHSQWQMCMKSECDLDSVSAYLSLTTAKGTYLDRCRHFCHWLQSMTNVHWTLSVI